jgi:DNA-binding response OmpR family regulator
MSRLHFSEIKVQASIVFLDDNEDLRELLPVLLKSALGVDCLSFGSLSELQGSCDDVLRAKVAILDINLGANVPSGIDAFRWLTDHEFRGKILFLTGHARSNPEVVLAERNGAQVLAKPLHPDELVSVIRNALDESS